MKRMSRRQSTPKTQSVRLPLDGKHIPSSSPRGTCKVALSVSCRWVHQPEELKLLKNHLF